MTKLIHNPKDLMDLTRDELDDILLEKYNNPLLRELIRITLHQLKEQTIMIENYRKKEDYILNNFENMKEKINEVIDNYKF